MTKIVIIDENKKVCRQIKTKMQDFMQEFAVEISTYSDIEAFISDINRSDKCSAEPESVQNEYLIIGNNSEQHKVKFSDIICIQKVKGTKYVDYVLEDVVLRDRKTLEHVMEEAGAHGFIMVEKGHAVNMNHVISMIGNLIIMDNGQELTVSRTRIQHVREVLNRYWGIE